jgi:choline kinase
MKAIILNSGLGKRMGSLTQHHPKCMTEILGDETILSRQLNSLLKFKIDEVIITTGYYDEVLKDYVKSLKLPLKIRYVHSSKYATTNYIYSIYLARDYLHDDVILMHGDLVYEFKILEEMMSSKKSLMTISSTLELPEKDFKAVIEKDKIVRVGIDCFDNAVAAQPLYKLNQKDWEVWLNEIIVFCENDKTSVYAENAFNEVSRFMNLEGIDVQDRLCGEIDNPIDLEIIKNRVKEEHHD